MNGNGWKLVAAIACISAAGPANAAITLFQQFAGKIGLSTDGGGTFDGVYSVSAFAPRGADVIGAWLYQTNFSPTVPLPVSLNGTPLTFGRISRMEWFTSAVADVTAIVKPVVDAGAGGAYDFNVVEGSGGTNGTALVVVYRDANAPNREIAILGGTAAVDGDAFRFNTARPMDPTVAGFAAELRLGIGFSISNQASEITVNGTRITNNAGNNDDGVGTFSALVTVGGNDDPFSPFLPSYEQDKERYDISSHVAAGDSSISVRTRNPSRNDTLFLATFMVTEGRIAAPAVPEPATWAMLIAGFGLVGAAARRRRTARGIA